MPAKEDHFDLRLMIVRLDIHVSGSAEGLCACTIFFKLTSTVTVTLFRRIHYYWVEFMCQLQSTSVAAPKAEDSCGRGRTPRITSG